MLFQQALASMSSLVLPVVAPEMSADLGLPVSLIGAYWIFIYGISFFASLGCGGYIQRYGPLRISQFALVCMGSGLFLSSYGSLWLIALSGMILGIGAAISTPCSTAILAKMSPPQQAPLIFSLKQTGVPVGGIMAGLFVPLLALKFGWRGAFIGSGFVCFFYAALLQPLRATYDSDRQPAQGFNAAVIWGLLYTVLKEPKYRELAMTWWAYVGVQALFGAFFVTFLVQELGYDLAAAGQIFAGAQAASIVARVFWGWFSSRYIAPRRMLAYIGLLIVVSVVATGFLTRDWSLAAVAGVAFLYAATAISFHGVLISEVVRVLPDNEVGSMAGGILSFAMLGMMSYPAVFGIILHLTGSFAIGFFAAGLPALIVSIRLFRRTVPLR